MASRASVIVVLEKSFHINMLLSKKLESSHWETVKVRQETSINNTDNNFPTYKKGVNIYAKYSVQEDWYNVDQHMKAPFGCKLSHYKGPERAATHSCH